MRRSPPSTSVKRFAVVKLCFAYRFKYQHCSHQNLMTGFFGLERQRLTTALGSQISTRENTLLKSRKISTLVDRNTLRIYEPLFFTHVIICYWEGLNERIS